MEKTLLEDPYFEVRELPTRRVVLVTRLPKEARTEPLTESFRRLRGIIRPDHRGWGIVMDMRAVVGRNDPEFESQSAEMRRVASDTFARVVVLIRTQVGALQSQRLAREEGREVHIRFDYEEALALAAGEGWPPAR